MSWKIVIDSDHCSYKYHDNEYSHFTLCERNKMERCTEKDCPLRLNLPPNVLIGKDAREFERKIEEGLKHPVGYVPTPKLDEAMKMMERDLKKKEQIDES